MKIRKIIASVAATIMAVSALGVTVFAEKIPGFEYIEETGEVIYCEKDESELPPINKNTGRRVDVNFNQAVAAWTQFTKINPSFSLSSEEKYIYITFDQSWNYRIRLRKTASGEYATPWSVSSQDTFYYYNFPTGVTYNIYLSANQGAQKTVSGTIYTQ